MTIKVRIRETNSPALRPYYAERFVGNEYSPDKWEYISGSGSESPEISEKLARGILRTETKTVKEFELD